MMLSLFCVGMLVADWGVFWLWPPWKELWDYCWAPPYCLACFLNAAVNLSMNQWIPGILYSATSFLIAWIWWNNDHNKRRRKRLRRRLVERVTDAGGKLKVVRPVEG